MSDQINVPISPGELVDKITILEIKKEFINNDNKLKNINHEYDLLMQIYTTQISETDGISELKNKLKEINLELWKIEDDIRDHERLSDFGSNFIELARSVYFTNDERAEVKKQINIVAGSNIIEEKSYSKY